MGKNSNYLPPGKEAEVARQIAAKNLCAWAGEHLPETRADADEPFDVNETVGPPTASHNLLILDPDVCLGFMCPAKSCVCDECKLARKTDENFGVSDDEIPLLFFGKALSDISDLFLLPSGGQMSLGLIGRDDWRATMLDTWYEYEYEQHLPAPMARGARASAELRLSGRMRF